MQSKSNKTLTKVAVAMSGGVDSSVVAAICVDIYGKENVFGVTMKLFESSTTAINDAKKVCKQLDIQHYIIDLRKDFKKEIIDYFISEYQLGKTPNPCVKCNKFIKFGRLFDESKKLGAEKLATGHYAIIEKNQLLKGKDKDKDQSYFLYGLIKSDLKNILFPIGDISKEQTRKIAKTLNLKTADKKDSQEVCFITGKTENYLSEKITPKSGDLMSVYGEKIGQHKGIIYYTIGQRKGIGGGFKKPVYVTDIDSNSNQIVIGEEKDLYKKILHIKNINWLTDIKFPLKCTAKIRYRMKEEKCTLNKKGEVVFENPQRAITPGQSIVFYKGDIVLGGGIISLS